MNIQIYAVKKNFDQQKAERYFKERRIPVQMMERSTSWVAGSWRFSPGPLVRKT